MGQSHDESVFDQILNRIGVLRFVSLYFFLTKNALCFFVLLDVFFVLNFFVYMCTIALLYGLEKP
jgi:hypothetical protein